MSMLNGQSLLASALAGLSSTYSTLMTNKTSDSKGLTIDDLTNVSNNTLMHLGNNYSFLQYLTTNFSNVDKDGDGEITSSDLNFLMNTMQSHGLTYNEIQSLCTTGNGDSSLLSTVLTYFNKIDANGDGRITSDEITKFSYDSQRYEVEAKYKSFKASSTSLFYSEGVEDDTSSVLDTLQPKFGASSST